MIRSRPTLQTKKIQERFDGLNRDLNFEEEKVSMIVLTVEEC